MGQRFEGSAFRFAAGALLTLALLASGYLLGITQFGPPEEPEPVVAEIAELDRLIEALQTMDRSLGGLSEQVAQLHTGLSDLQSRMAQQETAVEALANTVLTFSAEMAGQAEVTTAQLQVLAAAAESRELDTILHAVQSLGASLADLGQQVAQLQRELDTLQDQSAEHKLEVASLSAALENHSADQGQALRELAVGLRALSEQMAQQAETTAGQLQVLAQHAESLDLSGVLAATQTLEQSLAALAAQTAQLQVDLETLQGQHAEQKLGVENLAEAIQSLAEEVAGHAQNVEAQLTALTEALEEQGAAAAVAAVAPVQPAVDPLSPALELSAPVQSAAETDRAGQPATPLQPESTEYRPIPVLISQEPEVDQKRLALVLKIKARDTIWDIANRFQSPPSEEFINQIVELNQVDPYRLRIGQDLLVPLNEEVFRLVEVE